MSFALFSHLNLSDFRVNDLPSFIFLCGGPISNLDTPHKYDSIRDFVAKKAKQSHQELSSKILFAEDITDWFRYNYYKDLLEFEQDIAGLASLIVIFIESAGSIAELGSFSTLKCIKNKLLVFIESRYYNIKKESFIKLGPIKHIENIKKDCVKQLPWVYTEDDKIDLSNEEVNFEEIIRSITSRISKQPTTISFNPKDTIHISLLTHDFINLLGIARIHDLVKIFKQVGLSQTKNNIEKYLFILEKIKHITKYCYSGVDFFLPTADVQFIIFSFKSSQDSASLTRFDLKIILSDYRRTKIKVLQSALDAYKRDAACNA